MTHNEAAIKTALYCVNRTNEVLQEFEEKFNISVVPAYRFMADMYNATADIYDKIETGDPIPAAALSDKLFEILDKHDFPVDHEVRKEVEALNALLDVIDTLHTRTPNQG